jgi:hypothetical protein
MHKILLAAAAGVLAATGLGTAGGAAAATPPPTITGVVRADKVSPSNSAIAKKVTATCPAGKKVINASGKIIGGNGTTLLDEIYPSQDLTKVTVAGKDTDDAITPVWAVEAIATCADPPSGLKRYFASSNDDTTSPKFALKICPAGKAVLGTGMDIIGGQGEVRVNSIIPKVDTTGKIFGVLVNATADATSPPTGTWHVNGFAICADDVYKEQVVSADGMMLSEGGELFVYCPFGTVGTGTGYDQLGPNGEYIIGGIDPGGSATSATDRTYLTAFEEDGTPGWVLVRAYAICANR